MEQKRSVKDLSKAIKASFKNAERLFEDARNLHEYGCFPTAYGLFILSQEEYAKTFLLDLVRMGAIPWDSNICRALRNHTCKQLAGAIMEYLNMDWEKYLESIGTGCKIPTKRNFPTKIADAINIIRHEKVAREYPSTWLWDEESPCDKEARRIADGTIDRAKQNAFYVDVASDGQVKSTPSNINEEKATAEYEKTKRLQGVIHGSDADVETFKTVEFQKVSDTFKLLFGLTTVEEYNTRWY